MMVKKILESMRSTESMFKVSYYADFIYLEQSSLYRAELTEVFPKRLVA
jgi:hypothetical protein